MTGKRWGLILPALLLAACSTGQQATAPTPTSTTAPAPAASTRALGLYELSIQGSGAQASGRVTPAALRSQEIAGLTFTVTGVQVVTNGDGSRSYTAALNVTNTSGAAIGAPAIIPADIAGYTESGTYFRAGATTNQSGAPTSASGITLTQVTDSTYSMLFPVTGVSGADFAVPGGSSVTAVSAQGWRTPTLAAGATQAMSLGFTIPASNDAYRFSLVFGAFDKTPAVNHLVISQLYGAGGNAANSTSPAATLNADYVELFNPTNNVISTAGMSLQYASPAGAFVTTSTGQFYPLTTASIAPGRFLLIRMPIGTNGGTVTATPDQQGTLGLGAANGKVALASNTVAVNGPTAQNVVDFVGYGSTASTFEGAGPAPVMSNTNGDQRVPTACVDTNNNGADLASFPVTADSARNSASAPVACP